MTDATKSNPRRRVGAVVLSILAVVILLLGSGFRPDRPVSTLLPRYGAPPSRFVEVDGIRIHYRDEGSGPPLLLIHGTSSSLHTWQGWVARLSDHRRVIRLDAIPRRQDQRALHRVLQFPDVAGPVVGGKNCLRGGGEGGTAAHA